MVRPRSQGSKHIATVFLLCEGEETEPNYFRGVIPRQSSISIEYNPDRRHHDRNDVIGLKEWASDIMRDPQFRPGRDKIWIVLDKDENSIDRLKNVCNWCEKNDVGIAFSNPCFEYWLLLHFRYDESGQNKEDLYSTLGDLIGHRYQKNGDYSGLFKGMTDVATKNAKKVRNGISRDDYCSHNPFTSVDLLIRDVMERQRS